LIIMLTELNVNRLYGGALRAIMVNVLAMTFFKSRFK
jgi:hypothetical protein